MRVFLLILFFFICSALIIISNNNLYLISDENFAEFGNLYFQWILDFGKDAKTLTGEIIKINWLPGK